MGEMKRKYHRHFHRRFRERANSSMRRLFKKKMDLFVKDPHNKQLDNHALDHAWRGLRSIDITPNWIVVFKEFPGNHYLFMTCGDKTRVLKPWRIPDKPIPDWVTLDDKEYWS